MNEVGFVAPLPERVDVEWLSQLLNDAAAMSVDGLKSDVASGQRMLGQIELAMSRRSEIEASETLRPAPRADIAKAIGYLAELFSGGAEKRTPAFFAALTEDVIEAAPTIGALRQAVKALRQKQDFMPSISEVLRAIESEMAVDRSAKRAFDRLPEHAADIQEMVDERTKTTRR